MPSNPATETSVGTRSPRLVASSMAPMAITSLMHTMAVIGAPESSARAPARPLS
jgi:hypothetical protein